MSAAFVHKWLSKVDFMIFFQDLLDAPDFNKAVDGLARAFRDKHNLPEIYQLGLVVPNVDTAADELEARGLGPFFNATGAPTLWLERGQNKSMAGKLGMAYHNGFELELLEPGKGTNFYQQSLDPDGKIVVQHLGLLVKDVDKWADRLSSAGFPVWVRGKLKTGPSTTDFAYMDTVEEAGVIIEFISWRLFGRPVKSLAAIFKGAARLLKLLGKRSISL